MGINPFVHGSALHTDVMKTQALRQALDRHGFDAAFGGARRDEEKSRAKERVFSIRSAQHRWDPKRQRPELWRLYNTRKAKGESLRVFPLSNWTELDIWQYIHREAIPIVPLYFAAERPVVERDGALIMVDDAAHAARAGRAAAAAQGAISHAWLLPAHRRDRQRCRLAGHDHRGDARREDFRAPGPDHRSRRCRIDGEEEAGRLLLMKAESSLPASGIDAWLQAQGRKDLLRFITCGSVDDGKSTLIGRLLYESQLLLEDQLAALASESRAVRHPGRRARFRAAGGRAGRRARAGHHHRCRLSLFRHRATQVHRRRYARSRAVHAQHGDRRLDRRSGRSSWSMPARACSRRRAATAIWCRCWASASIVLAVNKMDLVGYSSAGVRGCRAQLPASSPAGSA